MLRHPLFFGYVPIACCSGHQAKARPCRSQLAGDAFPFELDRQQAGSYEGLQIRATPSWYIAFSLAAICL
jgi:hypothetical protein